VDIHLLKKGEQTTIILNGVKITQLGTSNIKQKTFNCVQCSAQFCSPKYLYQHMVDHPGKDGCYHCMNCGHNTQDLLSHLTICLRRKNPGCQLAGIQPQELSSATTFKCRYCRLNFKSKALKAEHVCDVTNKPLGSVAEAVKLTNESSVFKCRTCEKMYKFKHSLLHHLKVHEFPFSCPKCNKRLKNQGALNYHLVRKHPCFK